SGCFGLGALSAKTEPHLQACPEAWRTRAIDLATGSEPVFDQVHEFGDERVSAPPPVYLDGKSHERCRSEKVPDEPAHHRIEPAPECGAQIGKLLLGHGGPRRRLDFDCGGPDQGDDRPPRARRVLGAPWIAKDRVLRVQAKVIAQEFLAVAPAE